MDMSKAYIQAVRKHLPAASIVFDHFHLIKLFNDKLQQFRRWLFNQAQGSTEQEILKGIRWLLLKNPENLVAARNEHKRLQQALELNRPLAVAYYMKEDLRQLWSQKTQKRAAEFLADWIAQAKASGIGMLKKFAKTLQTPWDGILAYYDYRISTGPLEGTNNKIKTMKRQAYGYRDNEFLKLKIMAIHLTKYAFSRMNLFFIFLPALYFRYELEEVEGGVRSRVKPEHIQEETENLAEFDVAEFYPKIQCPMLILRATEGMAAPDSIQLPQEVLERMLREIPGSRYLDIPGSNHYSIVMQPNRLRDEAISGFLKQDSPTAETEKTARIVTRDSNDN
jgi:hypothetical protein